MDCVPDGSGRTCSKCGWTWTRPGPFPRRNCRPSAKARPYVPDPVVTARIDARIFACRACPEFRTDDSQAAAHRAFMWCHALDERPGQPRDCSAGRTARFQVRVLREPVGCEPWRQT